MRRTRAVQLRVTDEEYEALQKLAGDMGISVSEVIRERLGFFDVRFRQEIEGGDGESVSQRPAEASVEEARPVGSTPSTSAEVDQALLKKETQRIMKTFHLNEAAARSQAEMRMR